MQVLMFSISPDCPSRSGVVYLEFSVTVPAGLFWSLPCVVVSSWFLTYLVPLFHLLFHFSHCSFRSHSTVFSDSSVLGFPVYFSNNHISATSMYNGFVSFSSILIFFFCKSLHFRAVHYWKTWMLVVSSAILTALTLSSTVWPDAEFRRSDLVQKCTF